MKAGEKQTVQVTVIENESKSGKYIFTGKTGDGKVLSFKTLAGKWFEDGEKWVCEIVNDGNETEFSEQLIPINKVLPYKVGDPVRIHFLKVFDERKGYKRLIGKTEEEIICFLNKEKSEFVRNNETFLCEVSQVKQTYLEVVSIEKLLTSKENEELLKKDLNTIRDFKAKDKNRVRKVKSGIDKYMR